MDVLPIADVQDRGFQLIVAVEIADSTMPEFVLLLRFAARRPAVLRGCSLALTRRVSEDVSAMRGLSLAYASHVSRLSLADASGWYRSMSCPSRTYWIAASSSSSLLR